MNFEVRIKQKYLNETVFIWIGDMSNFEFRMYRKKLMRGLAVFRLWNGQNIGFFSRFTQESYVVTLLISNTYLVHSTFCKIPTCQNVVNPHYWLQFTAHWEKNRCTQLGMAKLSYMYQIKITFVLCPQDL